MSIKGYQYGLLKNSTLENKPLSEQDTPLGKDIRYSDGIENASLDAYQATLTRIDANQWEVLLINLEARPLHIPHRGL